MTVELPSACPSRKKLTLRAVDDPAAFRRLLDEGFRAAPELFPPSFAGGYPLKDARISVKLGLPIRRIRLSDGTAFSIRPVFLMPYMAGYADEASGPLFLRNFGVPFWALARVFGRNAMYWYRLELSLGRTSVVGTTVRRAELPEHLLADEHHQPRDGIKNYIATTVARAAAWGPRWPQTAGTEDLQAAYGAFRRRPGTSSPITDPGR